jgi:hypothetical protein
VNAGESRDQALTDALATGNAALEQAAHDIDRKPDRREVAKIAFIAAVAVSMIMGAVAITVSGLAFSSASRASVAQQAAAKDQEAARKLAEQAYSSAQEANRALQERGQAPVPIPAPDSSDPTDTLVAAATARVLAQLPDAHPTAAQLGAAVASYFIVNPVTPAGPTPGQISQALAGYLATSPPPSGPPGEDGKPGTDGKNGVDGKDAPPPTDAQIQQAFVSYVQANPEFLPQQLCRNYGQNFNQAKDLTSADGTRYTLYGCITEIQGPMPTSTSSSVPLLPGG